MRSSALFLPALILPLLFAGVSDAEILKTLPISDSGTCGSLAIDGMDFDLAAFDFSVVPVAIIFDDLVLTPADIGTTLTATAASDPGFVEFAARVTDGSHLLGPQEELLPGGCLFGSAGSPGMNGYLILAVTLTVEDLTLTWDGVNTSYSLEATAVFEGDTEVTGVGETAGSGFLLHPGYPNPFRSSTVIRYELGAPSPVRLRILDLRGRSVRLLEDVHKEAGDYTVRWDGRDDGGRPVAVGAYFYRLEAGSLSRAGKVIRIR